MLLTDVNNGDCSVCNKIITSLCFIKLVQCQCSKSEQGAISLLLVNSLEAPADEKHKNK